MPSASPAYDKGSTFSLDISSDGAASLQKAVLNKLSEFMGNYTDDVLAQYVVVLVGHGKHQAQAAKDLEAFLGDQSEAFVSWLWDHLCANIQLYTLVPRTLSSKKTHGSERTVEERNKEPAGVNGQVRSEEESRKAHSKGADIETGKDPDRNVSLSRKASTGPNYEDLKVDRYMVNEQFDQDSHSVHPNKQPNSPGIGIRRERKASDEKHQHHKRPLSPKYMRASRRLLQFAVREAVAPASSHLKSAKRLRSVVYADTENTVCTTETFVHKAPGDALRERHGKPALPTMEIARQAIPGTPSGMKGALATHNEREKLAGSVWDRLGRKSAAFVDEREEVLGGFVRGLHGAEEVEESRCVDMDTYEQKAWNKAVLRGSERLRYDPSAAVMNNMNSDCTEQSLGMKDFYAVRGNIDEADDGDAVALTQHLRSKKRIQHGQDESVTVQYRLAQNTDAGPNEHNSKSATASSRVPSSSQKIVNISVNVNTWKPHPSENLERNSISRQLQCQSEKAADVESRQIGIPKKQERKDESNQGILELKKRMEQVQLEMAKLRARRSEATPESQNSVPGSVSGKQQAQAIDDERQERIVFVTNIHFAATKDSVMAHFARCGDVQRVVMLTDGATGQPKGSAFVEFTTNDGANKALALSGSSFYSRILKVMRKEVGQEIQEVPVPVRPVVTQQSMAPPLRVNMRSKWFRGSPHPLLKSPSIPRSTANPTSLQWKRERSGGNGNSTPVNRNGTTVHFGRSLSYIRCPMNPAKNAETAEEHKSVSNQGSSHADSGTSKNQCSSQENIKANAG